MPKKYCDLIPTMTEVKTQGLADSNINRKITLWRLLALRAFILSSFIVYVLAFSLDFSSTLYVTLIVFSSIVFSLFSWFKSNNPKSISIALQLFWDSLGIVLFVWLAGRSTNPFIYYQLLIIAVSASILPEKFSWIFSGL